MSFFKPRKRRYGYGGCFEDIAQRSQKNYDIRWDSRQSDRSFLANLLLMEQDERIGMVDDDTMIFIKMNRFKFLKGNITIYLFLHWKKWLI